MSVSLWERSSSPRTAECDVAVLGAGIVGLSATLALQERGVDALAIERGEFGCGASSRNAGFLMRGAADNYAAGVRDWGRETARTLWRLSEQNLADLREVGVESLPSYEARSSAILALSDDEAQELERSAALLTEDGFGVRIERQGADAPWQTGRARLALVNPGDATVNPRELVDLIRRRVTLPVHEGVEAFAIEREDRALVVRAASMEIRAQSVLCCLNAHAPEILPEIGNLIEPNRGQMLAIEDPTTALDHAYYANHGGEYFRRADPRTIVVGGWRKHFENDERTTAQATTPQIQDALERFARETLGVSGRVVARWAGTMGFSTTGLPIVGRLQSDPRIVLCAGFTGHGMSLGHRTARLAVAHLLDGSPPPFPSPPGVAGGA